MKSKEEIEQLAEKYYPPYPDGTITDEIRILREGFIKGYSCQEDMVKDQTVTRFEVIDEHGRRYTKHNCKVELSYQDEGRTLKVIIKQLNKQD